MIGRAWSEARRERMNHSYKTWDSGQGTGQEEDGARDNQVEDGSGDRRVRGRAG